MEKESKPIKQTKLTPELLKELLKQRSISEELPKYVYHGSPTSPDKMNGKVLPKQAECTSGSEENTKYAIYAFDEIEKTIRYSIEINPEIKKDELGNVILDENGKPIGYHKSTIAPDDSDKMLISYGEIDPDAKGYIYCLDALAFTQPDSKGQRISEKSQTILAVYEVYYKDFPELFVFSKTQKQHNSFCDSLKFTKQPFSNTNINRLVNPDIEPDR